MRRDAERERTGSQAALELAFWERMTSAEPSGPPTFVMAGWRFGQEPQRASQSDVARSAQM